jgi:hypothetical protein
MNKGVTAAVQDCSWKDSGVGFYRNTPDREDFDTVAVSLGKPAAPPAPPQAANAGKPTSCAGYRLPPGSDCSKTPNPNPPPAAPVNCPAGSVSATVPAGQQCQAVPPPKDEDTLTFHKEGLQINAVIVNESTLAGQCHYDAVNSNGIIPERTDDFPIGAKQTVTRTYPAPPLAEFHATVTCTGDFNGTTDEFGNTAADVTG